MFVATQNLETIQQTIQQQPLVFLFLEGKNCSVCHSLKPQIITMLENYPEITKISSEISEHPDIAGTFSVFTVPVLLFFVEGKEYLRFARIVDTRELGYQLAKIMENYSA